MNDTLALIFLYKIGLTLVAASWALLESPTHSPPVAECPGADQAPHLAQPPGLNTPRVTLLPGGVNTGAMMLMRIHSPFGICWGLAPGLLWVPKSSDVQGPHSLPSEYAVLHPRIGRND